MVALSGLLMGDWRVTICMTGKQNTKFVTSLFSNLGMEGSNSSSWEGLLVRSQVAPSPQAEERAGGAKVGQEQGQPGSPAMARRDLLPSAGR